MRQVISWEGPGEIFTIWKAKNRDCSTFSSIENYCLSLICNTVAMFRTWFHKVDLWVVRTVISTGDDQEILLRKKIWWGLTLCWIFFFTYDFFMSISLQYAEMIWVNASGFFICISLFISFFFLRKRTELYGLILQLVIILFPSIKIFLLGGIFQAPGIVFAGLIGPIYALTFPNTRRAVLIFILYLCLIVGSTVYQQSLLQPGILQDPDFRYPLNRFLGGICVIFFVSMIYSAQLAKLKRIEEERLIQLHRAKSKLYTNITHEFRTPLTVILGMADGIENDPKSLLNKGVRLIKSNANKLLKLVNQLLTMSKLEADSMPVKLIQSDVIPFIRYILESFHSIAEEKNIRLHYLSKIEELQIDFDPEIIEEILSNLISNAIKFTSDGGDVYLQIETRSVIKGASPEDLILHVKDTGIGIAEDQLAHIFSRFYQADDESTRKAEGSGIGLALVKEYLNLIQGKIQVKSRIGHGTDFIIQLPITHTAVIQRFDYESNLKTEPEILEPSERQTDFRIEKPDNQDKDLPILLIVEDSHDVIEYLKTVLLPGYRIKVANDGNIGIELALGTIPDIIICDVMMPGKDGYEVCKTIKENFRTNHVPIIMLTAKADIDSKISGLEYGADAYVTKPFDKRELLIRIEKLIETRKKLKDKYSEIIYSRSDREEPKGLNEVFLHRVLDNLDRNFHNESYSIDHLCHDSGISRTQMHRKLIALTGKPTSDYIRNYRIRRAKEYLLNPDITVSEVAYQVGFKDPNYFTKSFAKEFGTTPSQYRSKHCKVKQ